MFNLFKKKNMVEFEVDVRNAFEEAFGEKAPKNLYYHQLADHYATNIPFVNKYFSGINPRHVYIALFKYFFMKAFEGRVASYIYKDNPERSNEAFDLYYSADEILEKTYRTNLPYHIEIKVIAYSDRAHKFGILIVDKFIKPGVKFNAAQLLILTQCIADAYAMKEIEKNNLLSDVAGVDNSLLLTMNEVRKLASSELYRYFESRGYEIEAYTDLIDSYNNFILNKDGKTYMVLFDAQVHPVDCHFFGSQFLGLYNAAIEQDAIPCLAGVHLGALDKGHFQNGILVKNEPWMFKFENVSRLVLLESEEKGNLNWGFEELEF